MEQIKNQIIDIIREYQQDERSSTGITGEKIIYGFSDESIAEDIVSLIQTIFDPENQPNKLGIETPFKNDYSDFDKAVEPAIRYLFKNHHPHTKIYIDYSNAELLEGQRTHNLNEEVPKDKKHAVKIERSEICEVDGIKSNHWNKIKYYSIEDI